MITYCFHPVLGSGRRPLLHAHAVRVRAVGQPQRQPGQRLMGDHGDVALVGQPAPYLCRDGRAGRELRLGRAVHGTVEQQVHAEFLPAGHIAPFGLRVPGQRQSLHAAAGAAAFDIVVADEVVGRAPALERAANHAVDAGVRGLVGARRLRCERGEEVKVHELVFEKLIAEVPVDFAEGIGSACAVERKAQADARRDRAGLADVAARDVGDPAIARGVRAADPVIDSLGPRDQLRAVREPAELGDAGGHVHRRRADDPTSLRLAPLRRRA